MIFFKAQQLINKSKGLDFYFLQDVDATIRLLKRKTLKERKVLDVKKYKSKVKDFILTVKKYSDNEYYFILEQQKYCSRYYYSLNINQIIDNKKEYKEYVKRTIKRINKKIPALEKIKKEHEIIIEELKDIKKELGLE